MMGLSTSGSISFGWALVAGRKRVPRPAAGKTALRTFMGMRASLVVRRSSLARRLRLPDNCICWGLGLANAAAKAAVGFEKTHGAAGSRALSNLDQAA